MKKIFYVLAVWCFMLPALLMAQTNPVVGSWKLNLEKSKFPAGMALKSLMRTVSSEGDSVKYSFEGEGPNGDAIQYNFTVKYDGNDYAVTGKGMPLQADQIAIKRIGSNRYSATLKKDGKMVGTSSTTVSHDGKTTTLTLKGTDAKGSPMKTMSTFDKQ